MSQESQNLFGIEFEDIFRKIKSDIPSFQYDFPKHGIVLLDENDDELAFLRLPLHISLNEDLEITNTNTKVLYLSIESGSAAVLLREGMNNLYHKTISAYMTRKKQGFSQIKYLKKKGKSRAGSRVRLAATTEFFENINQLSTDLMEEHEVSRIALDCSKTLVPFLFQSKIPPPFSKKDPRLYKIPLHIQKSNTSQLEAVIKKLIAPVLFYEKKKEEYLRTFPLD